MYIFLVFLYTSLVSPSSASARFKDNAADFTKVGYKTITRRGEEKEDYTKLEIEAQPLLMVIDGSVIDKKRITIEIKSGDQNWRAIDTPPSMRGGVYKWTESNVEPCLSHNVRIWVHGQEETSISFEFPEKIKAASLDKISASGYRPHMPNDLEIQEISESRIKVSWTPVQCAISYDVTYQKVTGGKAVSKQVLASHGSSLSLIDAIDSCSEYEIRVAAVIGDEYSEENVMTISTAPEIHSAEKLDPIINPKTNSVQANWRGFEKLSCISEYLVTLCKVGGECLAGQKVERDDSLQFTEYKAPTHLEECSDYSMSIKPVHIEQDIKAKVINFRTHSQPIEDVNSLFTNVNAEVDNDRIITVTWNAIKCANHYEIFRKMTMGGEWESIGTTQDNNYKQQGVSCTEYKYGVKVTVDEQESEIAESDDNLKIPPALSLLEQPSLDVEEKTNNSVTFTLNSHEINHMCKVDQYHIKYENEEDHFDPMALENQRISVIVPKENTKIEGRIKYKGFEWTSWVSSDSPLKEKQTGLQSGVLLPILIGSVIAVLVVSLVIFLVIRSRKSPVKYDEEKQEGNTEESKKLNNKD